MESHKMYKKVLLLLVFPILLSAGTFPKVGTTAAPFLKIAVGARAVAMGGNFVAVADDPTTLYWNPAGITALDKVSIAATHTSWFAGMIHGSIQAVAPMSAASALGVDITYLTSGDIEQTTLLEQNGTGIFYDATDFSMGVTYARRLTEQFSVAVKGKYIRQAIFNEEASTLAIDFGTTFQTGFNGLRIGMNLANFGGNMQMTGNDLSNVETDPLSGDQIENTLKTESWPLPIIFRVGLAIDIIGQQESIINNPESRLTLAVDGTHPNDNEETVGLGVEYAWHELFMLRAGYLNNHDVQDLSFGGGFKLRISGIDFMIDYAYADYGDLDSVQRFSAGLAF